MQSKLAIFALVLLFIHLVCDVHHMRADVEMLKHLAMADHLGIKVLDFDFDKWNAAKEHQDD